jgi:hypothetical protein
MEAPPRSLELGFPPQPNREDADREHAETARDRGREALVSKFETRKGGHNDGADDDLQLETAEVRHAVEATAEAGGLDARRGRRGG